MSRDPVSYFIDKTYHPEYGGYVYQPRIHGYDKFIEPFVTEKEASAFLDGWKKGVERLRELQAAVWDLKMQHRDDVLGS